MSVPTYRDARAAQPLGGAPALAAAIATLGAARREVIALEQACHDAQAAASAPGRAALEETSQTLGGLARILGEALLKTREAQATYDQLDAVERRLP